MGGGLTYPPLYLAYAFARHFMGNEFATMDVLAIGHLLLGYFLTWLVARKLGASKPAAALFSASFILSGPLLVMGRGWSAFNSLAVFIPALTLLANRLILGSVGSVWALCTGVVLGLLYHAGFPQLFVLGCFVFVTLVVSGIAFRKKPWAGALWVIPALAFALALVAPLALQQARISQDMFPREIVAEGIGKNLVSLMIPYPFWRGHLPNGWSNVNPEHEGHFFYIGLIPVVLFLLALYRLARSLAKGPGISAGSATLGSLCAVAAVCFLLALGSLGGLWLFTHFMPNGFGNHPFRILPWLAFYISLVGCLELDRVSSGVAIRLQRAGLINCSNLKKMSNKVCVAIIIVGSLSLIIHLRCMNIAFYQYGFKPYPSLPSGLSALFANDTPSPSRMLSVGALRTGDFSYPFSLPHNLPSLYGIPAFLGYNPVMEGHRRFLACLQRVSENPQSGLAEYGVQYVLQHRTLDPLNFPPQSANPLERVYPNAEWLNELVFSHQTQPAGAEEFLKVSEIANPMPLAAAEANVARPLPVVLRADGIDVDLRPLPEGGQVLVNALWWEEWTAKADGVPVSIAPDNINRVIAYTPSGATRLSLRFKPSWRQGLLLGAGFAILGGFICRVLTPQTDQRSCLSSKSTRSSWRAKAFNSNTV